LVIKLSEQQKLFFR